MLQRADCAEASLATAIGTLAGVVSASEHPDRNQGYAALISYEGSAQKVGPLIRPQLNLELQAISRDFTPLQLLPQVNRYSSIAQGRFATQIPGAISVGFSLARYAGRDGEPNEMRYAVTVGRRLGPLTLTLAGERIETRGLQRQSHLLLTLTMPLGTRGAIRATADTRGRRGSMEYSRFQPDEVGTFGMRAALSRGTDGFDAAGELSYYHNRFAALVQHSLIADSDLGQITGQQSTLTLSSQLAFAGGRLAFGRPVGPRFMIVLAHPSLEDAVVSVRQGAGRTNPQAVTGALGPALAPAGNVYSASDVRIDVDKLPPGYDIGTSQFTTVPGPAAGYAVTVGSDASRSLLGIAIGPHGQPLGLLGGLLQPIGKAKPSEPVLLFTNRAGRFAGNELSPGRYEVVLGTERKFRAEVTISAKSRGVVDVGSLKFTELQP